jgi:hypothetical protein
MDGIVDGVDETGITEARWKGKGEITLAQGRPSQ